MQHESHLHQQWQEMIDLMAELLDVPAGLIMQINQDKLEVCIANNSPSNPYKRGDNETLEGSGLYCEAVIQNDAMLKVPNALDSEQWKDNPDVKLNLVSYLGYPIHWPDSSIFGTICILDNKENHYNKNFEKLLAKFRDFIEMDLQLTQTNLKLEQKVQQRTQQLEQALAEVKQENRQRKQQQQQIDFIAHYDMLTKLPNRTLFADRFKQAINRSKLSEQKLAICILDLDNFKTINDRFGVERGDQLLIEVATRIKAQISEEDTVSRQCGDEFTLLLNDITSKEKCSQTLERILHSLSHPYFIDNTFHRITASLGVTLYPEDEADIDTLLRHADQAMYQAKLSGKHRYHFFDHQYDQKIVLKHHYLTEIEHAFNKHQFSLYYQPKVNMVSGKVYGVEALIRWLHPDKGVLSPLEFLPFIDGSDLECRLGDWVINQALMQLNYWLQQGIRLEVSVNISAYHLVSDSFCLHLSQALAKYPLVEAKYLQIEILESSAFANINTITNIINICQNTLGINVALDDFGTGYSSLSHLRNLPVNTIKIDQSFIYNMLDDPSDYAIIDGIVGLADSFNRHIIAEGVETTEHGLMLLIIGCEQVQGYKISRPMPADEIASWLKHYRPNEQWLLCGNKHRSAQQKRTALFQLIIKQWQQRFIKSIQASPESIKHWPIMNSQLCPCNDWLQRAQKSQLFEPDYLNSLTKLHHSLHLVTDSLFVSYQKRNISASQQDLSEVQAIFNKIDDVLTQFR